MKLSSECVIYLLFYILISTSKANVIKGQQWTYSYKGQIDTSSSACDNSLARWTITGILIGQSFDNYMIFRLMDLKTSLFNGDINDINLSKEKSIPFDAEILTKPFIIRKINHNTTIEITPNEPLWSLNMKRAIGSHFQIDFERGFDGEFIEHSLYGDCKINYISDKIGKDIIVNKIINHDKCTNYPFKHKTNVKRAESTKNYEPLKIETTKKYLLKDFQSILVVADTYSFTNITYKPMPILPYTQNINQYQEFLMLNHSKIEHLINTEENTETHKIIYEIDMESLLDRGINKTIKPEKQIEEFVDNFEKFKIKFNASLEHFNIYEEDYIENMFYLLLDMKTDTLLKLNEEIKGREDTLNITFLTLLPYIGTVETTNFIIEYIKNDFNFEGSEYLGVKFLSTFPQYIDGVNEDLIKRFEFLLELKTNVILKNAAILSFSNILQKHAKVLSDEKIDYYKNMFYEKYTNDVSYNNKMTYLLCLVNIGEKLDDTFIIDILINTSDNPDLRVLGMNGFKQRLMYSELIFDKFWAILKNETEKFDVRVTALDLLLSSDLSKTQFDEIVDYFKKPQKTIFNKHLYNYFYTSMISLQNITQFKDPLGSHATEFLQNGGFPDFRLNFHAWTTSRFRFAYTDKTPNFGRNFEGHIIADPLTNSINSMQLSYNYFTMSFDMGTYSLYFKIDNSLHNTYKNTILKQLIETDITVTDLLDLIKDFNFKMKNEENKYHVEIVVFIDFKAIASVYINPENVDKIPEIIINGLSLTENKIERRISYPLMDYVAFSSDLGTPLTIKHDIQDIFAGKHPKMDLNIRDYWYHQIWIESYNPIVKSPIASYKYYGYEIGVNILMDITYYRKTFSFYHEDESFQMIDDKSIGTSVGGPKELLKSFCAECENYYEIPNDDVYWDHIKKLPYFSVLFNYTRGKHVLFTNTSDEYMNNVMQTHQVNADLIPILRPLIYINYMLETDGYFQNELTRTSYKSIPYYPNQTMSFIKFKNNKEENINRQEIIHDSNYLNYTLEFSSSSVEDDYVKLHWTSTLSYRSIIENIDEIDKPKIPQTYLNFDIDYVIYNESRYKVAFERHLIFPQMNPDKFSLSPAEPTTGTIVIKYCDLAEDALDCPTNTSLIVKEKFWISDERKNTVINSDYYKNCQKQNKGFEFTTLSKPCIFYSHLPLHQYDNYEIWGGYYNETEKIEYDVPTAMYYIPSPDKMKIAVLKNPLFGVDTNEYWNKTINYFNVYANPNAIAYNDYEKVLGVKRSCIISPKIVKTLVEDVIDFDEKKYVAFVECLHKPLRGLTIQKIDDKHIGFHFWALNNKVIATVENGQLKITVNGDEIKKSHYDEINRFKITFLSKNVVIISEKEVEIYYNTEYLYTKMSSMYTSRLCGFCANIEN